MLGINLGISFKCIRHCSKINSLVRRYYNGVSQLFRNISQDEQAEILDTLHRCAEENISRHHLNEQRLNSLQQYLKFNEKFTSLDQLLQVNGIGLHTLGKICKSILENDESEEVPKVKVVHGLLTPPLDKNMTETITTVVGLTIGFNAIGWAKLHCGTKELEEWNVYDLSELFDKKCELHNIYQTAMNVCSLIPKADVYTMENSNWTNVTNSKIPANVLIRRALLTTAILTLFNTRVQGGDTEVEQVKNQVYFLKSCVPARIFQTLIGSEKVSAQNIVEDIFQKKPDVRHSEILIPFELYDSYKVLSGHLKENMCQSVLLVIAFTELVLFNNVNTMRILAGRSNKKIKH